MIKIHLEGVGSDLLCLVEPFKKFYKVEAVKSEFGRHGKLGFREKSKKAEESPSSNEVALFICVT